VYYLIKKATIFQLNLFVIVIQVYWSQRRDDRFFPRAKHWQGQRQTPQSIAVPILRV